MEPETLVKIIWGAGLVVAYLSLPMLLRVLTRIVLSARKINLYFRDTRVHSQRLPKHLNALPALDTTIELLGAAKGVGGEIAGGAEALCGVLIQRTGQRTGQPTGQRAGGKP